MKKFFRARLQPEQEGLIIRYETWVSIHETPCFCYCVTDWDLKYLNCLRDFKEQPTLKNAKQSKRKIKRIDKNNSRFAFTTREKALDNLRYLKRLQLKHLKRDIEFLECFLDCEQLEDHSYKLAGLNDGLMQKVPNSDDLVQSHYVFD